MKKINLTVNAVNYQLKVDPLKRLIDLLRDDIQTLSVKEGCGEGECGSCSVILNGKLVNSCLMLAGSVNNAEILTLEGLKETKRGVCIIESFADEGSVQCGFCTPGMVLSAEAILSQNPNPSKDYIRNELSGNLCRCTGYDMIVKGIKLASEKGEGLW